jgi:hypothetical protein
MKLFQGSSWRSRLEAAADGRGSPIAFTSATFLIARAINSQSFPCDPEVALLIGGTIREVFGGINNNPDPIFRST